MPAAGCREEEAVLPAEGAGGRAVPAERVPAPGSGGGWVPPSCLGAEPFLEGSGQSGPSPPSSPPEGWGTPGGIAGGSPQPCLRARNRYRGENVVWESAALRAATTQLPQPPF